MALKTTPQNLAQQPFPSFIKDDFDSAVWIHGYNVTIEKAIRCPCEGIDGNPLSDCQNCHGIGYFFINPLETVGLISGINRNTQYKEWSVELIGTISLTVRDLTTKTGNIIGDLERIAFYDRITLNKRNSAQIDVFGYHSEVLNVRDDGTGNKFVFLTYKPQSIIDVFYYTASNAPLTRFEGSLISSTNPYILTLPTLPGAVKVISVRYKHDLQYHVIDIPHEIRHSTIKNKNGQIEAIILPINAICRRVHLVQVQKPNFDGTGIQNNDTI